MCGIVGYVGAQDARGIVLAGLRRLEYRGYDSCGIAMATPKGLVRRRTVGAVPKLEALVHDMAPSPIAIGHTRWATHGSVTEANAHPHTDCREQLAIVHNGVIENFSEIRAGLAGHQFRSQTDTEVLAHLIESEFQGDLYGAVMKSLRKVRGTFAILVNHVSDPGTLVFARRGAPLLLGVARDGYVVASDTTAVLGATRDVVYLEDDEVGRATKDALEIQTLGGRVVNRSPVPIEWTADQAERGGFPHFMLKEIYECPRAVRETTLKRLGITPPLVRFEGLPGPDHWAKVPRVRLLACGSSHHAAQVGKHLFESLAGVACEATLASEYRHSQPVEERGTLGVAITQSGETADTLGAMREAKRRGLETLALVNVQGSTAIREADYALLTRAGPEIGVASTKTYLAQLAGLSLLAIHFGEARRGTDPRRLRHAANQLKQVPHVLESLLQTRQPFQELAGLVKKARSAFFLGRGPNHATAQEAALKLKEIAYVHAEGYSSGELKHGPFALLTKRTPVFAFLAPGPLQEKDIGTVLEIRTRGAPVYGIATGDPKPWEEFCTQVVGLPEIDPLLSPLAFGMASHLLAYEVASLRGLPIDRPRHLAKSVTVE